MEENVQYIEIPRFKESEIFIKLLLSILKLKNFFKEVVIIQDFFPAFFQISGF